MKERKKILILVSTLRNVKANGSDIKIRMIMDFAELVLKIMS